jgi:hypothetical protein
VMFNLPKGNFAGQTMSQTCTKLKWSGRQTICLTREAKKAKKKDFLWLTYNTIEISSSFWVPILSAVFSVTFHQFSAQFIMMSSNSRSFS